jgi:hypothetical protein
MNTRLQSSFNTYRKVALQETHTDKPLVAEWSLTAKRKRLDPYKNGYAPAVYTLWSATSFHAVLLPPAIEEQRTSRNIQD